MEEVVVVIDANKKQEHVDVDVFTQVFSNVYLVATNIFVYLDGQSLGRFARVSKFTNRVCKRMQGYIRIVNVFKKRTFMGRQIGTMYPPKIHALFAAVKGGHMRLIEFFLGKLNFEEIRAYGRRLFYLAGKSCNVGTIATITMVLEQWVHDVNRDDLMFLQEHGDPIRDYDATVFFESMKAKNSIQENFMVSVNCFTELIVGTYASELEATEERVDSEAILGLAMHDVMSMTNNEYCPISESRRRLTYINSQLMLHRRWDLLHNRIEVMFQKMFTIAYDEEKGQLLFDHGYDDEGGLSSRRSMPACEYNARIALIKAAIQSGDDEALARYHYVFNVADENDQPIPHEYPPIDRQYTYTEILQDVGPFLTPKTLDYVGTIFTGPPSVNDLLYEDIYVAYIVNTTPNCVAGMPFGASYNRICEAHEDNRVKLNAYMHRKAYNSFMAREKRNPGAFPLGTFKCLHNGTPTAFFAKADIDEPHYMDNSGHPRLVDRFEWEGDVDASAFNPDDGGTMFGTRVMDRRMRQGWQRSIEAVAVDVADEEEGEPFPRTAKREREGDYAIQLMNVFKEHRKGGDDDDDDNEEIIK